MIFKTPTQYYLVSGASDGYTPLNAFDRALLRAGIGNTNIVKMSSIVPPRCKLIYPIALPPGAIVPAAYAFITSDVPGQIITAAVAVAFPKDQNQPGLIMEYSALGHKKEIEEIVQHMVIEGMKFREQEIREIKTEAIGYKVKKIGAALAAVVLWG